MFASPSKFGQVDKANIVMALNNCGSLCQVKFGQVDKVVDLGRQLEQLVVKTIQLRQTAKILLAK